MPEPFNAFMHRARGAWELKASQRTASQQKLAEAFVPIARAWMEASAGAWVGMWKRSDDGRGRVFALVPGASVNEDRGFNTDGLDFLLEWPEHGKLTCQVSGKGIPRPISVSSPGAVVEVGGWRLAIRAMQQEVVAVMAGPEAHAA